MSLNLFPADRAVKPLSTRIGPEPAIPPEFDYKPESPSTISGFGASPARPSLPSGEVYTVPTELESCRDQVEKENKQARRKHYEDRCLEVRGRKET